MAKTNVGEIKNSPSTAWLWAPHALSSSGAGAEGASDRLVH